jgi:signal transduction histidine kinase
LLVVSTRLKSAEELMNGTPLLPGRRRTPMPIDGHLSLVGVWGGITRMVGRLRERVAALPAVAVDTGLALVLAGIGVWYLWLLDVPDPDTPGFFGPSLTSVALALATTLPVALRRRFPMTVLVIVAVFEILAIPLIPSTSIGAIIAGYTVATYCPRRKSIGAFTVVLAGFIVALYHFGQSRYVIEYTAIIIGAWVVGEWQKIRRAYTAELHRRTVQLAQEREQQARLAVAQERVRIARELHDVLAHHVSVMGIQAAAARRIVDHRREDALAALTAIETASRQAIDQLHQLVGLLRRSDETDDRVVAPQPGLEQLPALVAEIREAGLSVELIMEGDQRPLPPTVQLSAYRIIQEALTNTVKHAGPAQAWVRLRYTDTGLELEVLDDGTGPPPTPRPGGNGLVGMRERVALHGGHLQIGARPEGGFRVHASLRAS